jgi:IS30 family transposase
MTTWFCDAYASWQKGGIENANGGLRRWLPRQLYIDRTSDQEIQEIVLTTNLIPRKCLGFKTPFQALPSLERMFKSAFLKRLRFAPESRHPLPLRGRGGALPSRDSPSKDGRSTERPFAGEGGRRQPAG